MRPYAGIQSPAGRKCRVARAARQSQEVGDMSGRGQLCSFEEQEAEANPDEDGKMEVDDEPDSRDLRK